MITTPSIDSILNQRFALRQLLRNKAHHTLIDGTVPAADLTPDKEPEIRTHISNIATAIIADPALILNDTYDAHILKRDWDSLCLWSPLDDAGEVSAISANTRKGHKLLDHYMKHFYDVGNHANRTLRSLITEGHRELIEKALMLNLMHHSTPYKSEIRRAIIMSIGGNSTVTKYKAVTAKALVAYYGARRVLDPCIGWGGRMLGALAANAEYVGCEPDPNTVAALRKILDDPAISSEHRGRARIFESPCEDVLSTEIAAMPQFDMVLTSPPYFNLELYVAGEQSTSRYPIWEDWVAGWLKPVILAALAALREGGVSCWSVKNFKTDRQYNLGDMVIAIHKEAGWTLSKTVQVDGPSRMGTGRIGKDGKASRKSKEETYCFTKGDAPAPAPAPVPLPETPYSKMKKPELLALCREKNIKGAYKMNKEQLTAALALATVPAAEATIEHI